MENVNKGATLKSPIGLAGISGILATVGMSAIMMIGMVSGKAPMPEPIPIAIVKLILSGVPKPLLMISGMLSHLAYGGVAGLIFLKLFNQRATQIPYGLLWGVVLWLVMQMIVLPVIGW